MIHAKEARKLAGPTLDEKIEALGETIEALAKLGHRKCKCGWHHKEDTDLWIQGGYEKNDEWKMARKKLESLDYKVTFYYNEGSMAVDMYTLIEW